MAAERFNQEHLLTEKDEHHIEHGPCGADGALRNKFCAALQRAGEMRAACKATLEHSTSEHAMVALEHNAKLQEHALGQLFTWASDAANSLGGRSAEESPLWGGLVSACALLHSRPSYAESVLSAFCAVRSNALLRQFLAAAGGGGSLAAAGGDPVRHTAAIMAWLLQGLLAEGDTCGALIAPQASGSTHCTPLQTALSSVAAPLAGSLMSRCKRNMRTAVAARDTAQVFRCADILRMYYSKLSPLLIPPCAPEEGWGGCPLRAALQGLLDSASHCMLAATAAQNAHFADSVLALPSSLHPPQALLGVLGGVRSLLAAAVAALVPSHATAQEAVWLSALLDSQHVHAALAEAPCSSAWGGLTPEQTAVLPCLPPPQDVEGGGINAASSATAISTAIAAAVSSVLVFALGTLKEHAQGSLESDTLGMCVAPPCTHPVSSTHLHVFTDTC